MFCLVLVLVMATTKVMMFCLVLVTMMATELIMATLKMEISPVVLWVMVNMKAWSCGVMGDER
jgi:hypothetical protein